MVGLSTLQIILILQYLSANSMNKSHKQVEDFT